MSRAQHLFHLQETDSQIDKHNKRLMEIQAIIEDDSVVKAAKAKSQSAKETLETTQKILQNARNEVQTQRTKIKQSEDRLYSGGIANPKELEDIQNEIEALKRYLEILEERQLEEMMSLDEVQGSFDEAQEKLAQAIAEGEARNAELINEKGEIEKNLTNLITKRESQVSTIETDDMQLYEKLRSKRAGVAVAGVQDRNCAACGSTLGTANHQQARSPSKITQCETCERILFAE